MCEPAQLKYHRTVFDLLGREPVGSEEALRLIEKAEADCRRRLAASVREWFSLRDAVALIPRWWHPRPLASVLNNFRSGGRIALGADGGDCEWFVKPDGSDDPPVVVDEWFGGPDDGERPCADRFSNFLFCWVWDGVTHEAHRGRTGFGVQAHHIAFGPMELDFLREQFQDVEAPRGEGGETRYFFTAGQRVMAWTNRIPLGTEVTTWYLTADSAADLASLLRRLWPCLARVKLLTRSPQAQEVLEQVRGAFGPPPAPK